MFNKKTFSDILKKINHTYDTMTDFAKKADFDRTYISKYINMKLDNPPTPKILEKIAKASNRNNKLSRTYGNMCLFFSYNKYYLQFKFPKNT